MTVENSMNPLSHTLARRYLQAGVDSLLEAGKRAALEAHLAACPECRRYAEQLGALERDLPALFHRQWDAASDRAINLLPGVRTRYRQKLWRSQFLSLANTLATVSLVVGLLLLLNGFISSRQVSQPAGDLTPTPTTVIPAITSPTPAASVTPAAQAIHTLPADVFPSGSLAFVASREDIGDLYLINADGSGETRLFADNLSHRISPAWSPDGSRLAFVSSQDGNAEIYIINTDDSQRKRLTDNPAEDTAPAWSPDGKSIAFASDRSGYSEVYVMDTSGSNVIQLTHTQAANIQPTWSPDGKFIAFASNRDGYWQIYRMNADGSEPINLSNNAEFDDREPAWSPDGQRIAMSSQPVRAAVQEIYVMNTDGSGRVRLTGGEASMPSTGGDFTPTWSPDGQWLAFWSYRDNPVYGDIYFVPAGSSAVETDEIIRLTTQGASQPAWKP